MSSWQDPTDSAVRDSVNDLMRNAAEYGFLRGFDCALRALMLGDESLELTDQMRELRLERARQIAEEFLTKLRVEELIG